MADRNLLRDRNLYVIFSITMIAVMGVASLTPALPKISQALDLSKGEVALLISAFTFPGVFLTPFAGIVADRWGRKVILVPSLFIFAIAGTAIFFIHDFHIIVILRVLQGVGAASLGSMNTTLIGDFFKGKELPTAMGFNASVLSLSTALYPLIGGALAALAWYVPFILPILAVPVGLFVLFAMPESNVPSSRGLMDYLKATSKSIGRREVLGVFILGVLTFVILYGAFLTYLPFLLNEEFGLEPPQIGLLFSLSSLTSALMATQVGKLTQRFGGLKLLRAAYVLYFAVIVLMPHIHNMIFFVVPVLFFGAAQALNIPSLQTALARLAPDDQRAVFMSLNGMILRLGQTLGPIVIGFGYGLFGLQGAFHLAAGVAVLGLIVQYTMLNEDGLSGRK